MTTLMSAISWYVYKNYAHLPVKMQKKTIGWMKRMARFDVDKYCLRKRLEGWGKVFKVSVVGGNMEATASSVNTHVLSIG
jgi:hypothetical protein